MLQFYSERPWVRLDNAGKVFPSIASDRVTNYFRLSVRLSLTIQKETLQRALEAILPRFPMFNYRLMPGVFWYSLVHEKSLPKVFQDSASPCMPFAHRVRQKHLFRVRYYKQRIAVEISHALTDGRGAMCFLKALVCQYLVLAGQPLHAWGDVMHPAQTPDPGEWEDAFQKLRQKSDYPRQGQWDKTFILPFRLLHRGEYGIISGILSAKATLIEAKKVDLSLSEFLTARLILAYQDVFESLCSKARKKFAAPVRIVIPVDLRQFYHSPTLRNFFVVIPIEIDLRLGHYTEAEVYEKVKLGFLSELDEKLLLKQVSRNLRGELHPLARIAPLIVKNLFLTQSFISYEKRHTSSLSNLGRLEFPDEVKNLVTLADFIPPPSPYTKNNCCVITLNDQLCISFGRTVQSTELERHFFTGLRKLGLSIKIETNRGDY